MKNFSFVKRSGMKLRLLLFLLIFPLVHHIAHAKSDELTERLLIEVLDEISRDHKVYFTYDTDMIKGVTVYYEKEEGENVQSVLSRVLAEVNMDFQIFEERFVIIYRQDQQGLKSLEEMIRHMEAIVSERKSMAENRKIHPVNRLVTDNWNSLYQKRLVLKVTGRVIDANGDPLIGVNILVKGTTKGTTTDFEGRFSISDIDDQAILVVSYVGYKGQEVEVKGQASLTIIMQEDVQTLDEVVVTALGIEREEKALGYAVQKVGGREVSSAKGVDVATSLTGRVAGLNIKNSTEFNVAPSIELRGESPLIVIDGVATQFVSLRDIPADDIEDITVLKGATASALYGSRGGAGAIMITTKKSRKGGLDVTVNSSTMTDLGYLVRPEVQTSYSTGQGGIYQTGSYVWGDKLDIGRTATVYNPFTYEWEEMELVSKGKNNLQNFQRSSLITNNNISIAHRGENGGVRASATHVYNQGQYENNRLNKVTYSISGDMEAGRFSFDGGMNYNKRFYPNMGATGYGGGGILYNITVWSGTEYDIRDYQDYWEIPDEKPNWMDTDWYDNPYFIVNEIVHANDYNVMNGYFNTGFEVNSWLNLNARFGADMYSQLDNWRNPIGAVGGWSKLGYYSVRRQGGYSINGDFMATAEKRFNDFNVEGFVGAGINYRNNDSQTGETQGGLSVPGFYSLKASVSPATVSSSLTRKQDNSIYGRLSTSWKSIVFLEATGRNDWSSTLDIDNQSYFYPSFASSVVLTEIFDFSDVFEFWKIRGSWTRTKFAPGIYSINQLYSMSSDVWNSLGTASYPTTMRNSSIKPVTTDSWEIGSGWYLFGGRMELDVAYYNTLRYNQQRNATISSASGFSSTQINIDEDLRRKGVEIVLSGDLIKNDLLTWNSRINWSRDRYIYDRIDQEYSTDHPWVKDGERWDWVSVYDWERDSEGNLIHYGGLPRVSSYPIVAGYSNADFIWGWTNNFDYKRFSLSFSFDGRVGGIAHSVTDQAMWNSGSHPDSDNEYRYDMVVNGKRDYVGEGVAIESGAVDYDSYGNILRDDRVFIENNVPVSYETYEVQMAPYIGSVRSQFLFSQTFLKLRDFTLSYHIPSSISSKMRAEQVSVSLIGQNLWMWAKDFKYSDPDVGADNLNSASIRYFGMNLNINF